MIALLAAYYGSGRFVYHNGHISTHSYLPGADPYVRQIIDWAANLGPTIALVETGGSVSNSVINALNDMDRKFDFFDTSDFSDISFNGYDAVIIAMNGGHIEEPSIHNVADYAESGGNLIMIGGSSFSPFIEAVDTYLLDVQKTYYSWSRVSGSPHFQVTNSNHPMTNGLPDTHDFTNLQATYYMIRSNDTEAHALAENGDGYDALIQKQIGNGHLNWFINCPSSSYWGDNDDYNLLKTIIRNMLMQGVDYVYHSPSSRPRGLAYRYYAHLYNCDDDDNIYDIRHNKGALINTFSSPGRGIHLGLAYDGQYLWNADMGTDTIYKLNYSDMSIVDSFVYPRNNPADIAYGGGYLWAAILQPGPIIKIDPDTGMEVDSVEVPSGSRPFGLTWVDGYLYVSDTNKDLIYKIDPKRMKWSALSHRQEVILQVLRLMVVISGSLTFMMMRFTNSHFNLTLQMSG